MKSSHHIVEVTLVGTAKSEGLQPSHLLSRPISLVMPALQRAQSEGFAMSVGTLNALLTTLGNCGRWKEGHHLLGRMQALGLEPTLWSVNAVLDA